MSQSSLSPFVHHVRAQLWHDAVVGTSGLTGTPCVGWGGAAGTRYKGRELTLINTIKEKYNVADRAQGASEQWG